jgi:hypothetical protein
MRDAWSVCGNWMCDAAQLQAFFDAAVCFFVPFLAASPTGSTSAIDVFSIGTTVNVCMLGVVTMEIMTVARYWTWWFGIICVLSYALIYPFVLVFPLVEQAINRWDMTHFGVGVNIMRTPFFWVTLVTVYATTFSVRYFERSFKWLFRPDDNMIRAELEVKAHRAARSGSGRVLSGSEVPDVEDAASKAHGGPRPPPARGASGHHVRAATCTQRARELCARASVSPAA